MRIPIPLKDGAYAPNEDTLRKTYWLHQRHTSVTYISRMVEMLEAFTKGFEDYVAKDTEPGSFLDFLQVCYSDLADHKEGLARLRKAEHNGFKLIRGGMSFREPFYDRASEYNFEPIGFFGYNKPCKALWCWIDKVIPMCNEVEGALWGYWYYPLFDTTKYKFPDQLPGLPFPQDIFIKDGEDIPVTGIWQQVSLKSGCPNFLIQGEKAPKANLPIRRYDTPEHYDNIANIHYPARSEYDIAEFPVTWQLMWEDDRWRDGDESFLESEYINGLDTELPKEPPVALRDPPKFP
jgi:hypothetical protein